MIEFNSLLKLYNPFFEDCLHQLLILSKHVVGYIGSVSFLEMVLRVVDKLRTINPKLVYGKYTRKFSFYG